MAAYLVVVLSLKVATELNLGFMAVAQNVLLCMLMVFPGGYIILPLCLHPALPKHQATADFGLSKTSKLVDANSR